MTGAAAVAAVAAAGLLAGSVARGDGNPPGMCNDYCVGVRQNTCGGNGRDLYCDQNEQGNSGYTKNNERITVVPRWDDVNLHRTPGIGLTGIELQWNAITEVLKDAFKLICKDVKQIRLDNNQITVVEPGAFDGCGWLSRLRLRGNQLKTIVPGAFDGCPMLRTLYLNDNQLVEIRAGVFQLGASLAEGLTNNLNNLYLGGNPIARVEQGAFDGVPALTDAATRALIEAATVFSSPSDAPTGSPSNAPSVSPAPSDAPSGSPSNALLPCGDGTVEQDGECVPTATLACGDGTVEQDGECVPTATLACGDGTVEQDGECIPSATLACGDGTVEQDGKCVPTGGAGEEEGEADCGSGCAEAALNVAVAAVESELATCTDALAEKRRRLAEAGDSTTTVVATAPASAGFTAEVAASASFTAVVATVAVAVGP